jgi:hypothetical protein
LPDKYGRVVTLKGTADFTAKSHLNHKEQKEKQEKYQFSSVALTNGFDQKRET